MFCNSLRLILVSLTLVGGATLATAQDNVPTGPPPAPSCATPLNLRSGSSKSTPRSDTPPQLHQRTMRPAAGRPADVGAGAIITPTANSPNAAGSGINDSAGSTRHSILRSNNEPPTVPSPSATTPTAASPVPQWLNDPDSAGSVDCLPIDPCECVEMNFGDMNSCDVQCPPQMCPTPFYGAADYNGSCVPLQPLPSVEMQPSGMGNSLIHQRTFNPAPEWDRQPAFSPVEYPDKPDQSFDTLELDVGDLIRPRENTFAEESVENEQLDESPRQGADERTDHEDYIFGTAAFKMPQHQQPPSAADTASARNGVVIHPPMIQPYNQNQHTFVVQNLSEAAVKDLVIEISVPRDARILATLPANSASSPQAAAFRFDQIQPGESVPIHLTAVSDSNSPIEFEANLVSRSVYSFSVHDREEAGILKNVSYSRSPVNSESDVQPIPGNDMYIGPVLVRNPYFQSRPRDQKAALPTSRR